MSPEPTVLEVAGELQMASIDRDAFKNVSDVPVDEEQYVLALDQGTTSARVIVFSSESVPVASHQVELNQHYPHPGWVEHDPMELIRACRECIDKVGDKLDAKRIPRKNVKALGITNQRETTVLWDKRNGQPVYNAIVWSDTRTEGTVVRLEQKPNADKVPKICGLHISTYFAAVKVRWILDNVPKAREVYEEGCLCFGTVDSWILYNFTNGARHITDATNASRSMFMNIQTLEYDAELVDFFDVPKLNLPDVVSSSEIYGYFSDDDAAFPSLPISGCLGDQSSALVGHLGFDKGDAKNTYGTGCFLLYNTGNDPVTSENGLLTTIAFQLKGQKPVYALEGSIAVAGSIIKWFRNNLGLIETSEQMSDLAGQVKDSAGVYFVTAFSGLFAPYWRRDARGTIVGLTAYTTRAHIARAAIEATCFQTRAILESMSRDSGVPFHKLLVDGGMSSSAVAMQIQSDILGMEVVRPGMREPTALGAAIVAGLATGVWNDLDHVRSKLQKRRTITSFTGSLTEKERDEQYRMWGRAVEKACGWVE
ncbi:glycerol kinase [Sugiyamaella lignohabitans]|uniref:glycerol kinase n=1 Tax=Sugiyamaella lignohabitans TaxID=796027 RepID=A0A167EEH8_9ASCO|nr:glycerol kinase [Sugiyamaella lignohabitans]ANB13973.1 glycerol kinase [Sugiyamaella lignohabitans]